ncbi:hypothetical protein AJ79_08338 [Helicocarpus griseus UAMH5409]|uniref:Cytochrome P450 monooxygenase n=1 Tax=Helicocarpus griseus UAMH5409 TaxID=1447875 RepID=A0A2B7WTU2_9EURO|nr:hypothetical protein AJ79_08338 [Helicocarpus griseus UAMH5409]
MAVTDVENIRRLDKLYAASGNPRHRSPCSSLTCQFFSDASMFLVSVVNSLLRVGVIEAESWYAAMDSGLIIMSVFPTYMEAYLLARGDVVQPAVLLVALFAILIVVLTSVVDFLLKHRKLVDVPVLNLDGWNFDKAKDVYNSNFTSLIKAGYEQYRGGVFQLWSPEGYQIILSPDFVDEMKNLQADKANLASAVEERFIGSYKWMEITNQINNRAVYKNLTAQMGALIPDILDEARYALDTELPSSSEYTPVKIYNPLLRIVTMMSGRVFVGPSICRNEDWIEASISYTLDTFQGSARLKQWTLALRPILAYFFQETRRIEKHHATARRLLVPIIKARAEAQNDPKYVRPNDMIQWIMDQGSIEKKPPSFKKQAEMQLLIGLAGIHTTTLTCTQALFDLAARPEYIGPLREEARQVMAEAGGKLEKKDISRLIKLDSFIKESQRMSPPDMITFDRVIEQPLTLSNGFTLPKGARLAVPAGPISLDDSVWKDAEKFDGFRFAKLRQSSANLSTSYQFVTTGPNAMHFGHGRHACPGRFFAANEIKIIMALMLLKYDIKLENEEKGRPANKTFGSMISPDVEAGIMLKVRQAV